MPESGQALQSRNLSLLVMLLLALHILFGVTALIGILVAHGKLASTSGTPYHSQIRWLIATFWVALAGYSIAVWAWMTWHVVWPVLVVAGWITYRLLTNYYCWKKHRPIHRIL